jgi:hypothetical protein
MDAQRRTRRSARRSFRRGFVILTALALLVVAPGLATAGQGRASGTAQVSFEGVIVGSIKVDVTGRYEDASGSIQFSGTGPRGGESWRADIDWAEYWIDGQWHVAFVSGCLRTILEPACRYFTAQFVDGRDIGPGNDEFSMGAEPGDPLDHTWYWVEKGNLVVWV